jgi:hypothetical protein
MKTTRQTEVEPLLQKFRMIAEVPAPEEKS